MVLPVREKAKYSRCLRLNLDLLLPENSLHTPITCDMKIKKREAPDDSVDLPLWCKSCGGRSLVGEQK